MRVNPSLLIQGSKEVVNPASPSWWAEQPRPGFTAYAWQEWPRMRRSRFAAISRNLLDGQSGPSSIDAYRAAKKMRGEAA